MLLGCCRQWPRPEIRATNAPIAAESAWTDVPVIFPRRIAVFGCSVFSFDRFSVPAHLMHL